MGGWSAPTYELAGLVFSFLLLASLPSCSGKTIVLDDFASPSDFGTAQLTYNPPNVLGGCANSPQNNTCNGLWWWGTGAGPGSVNDTMHLTYGPSTSFNFTFTGDSVSVMGLVNTVGARGSYSIDGISPISFSSYSTSVNANSQAFFRVGSLDPARSHTLMVAYNNDDYGSGANRRWLHLDSIQYTVPDASPTASPEKANITSKNSHTGAIAGGIVGTVVILLIIAGCIFYMRRRRQSDIGMLEAHPNGSLSQNPSPSTGQTQHSSVNYSRFMMAEAPIAWTSFHQDAQPVHSASHEPVGTIGSGGSLASAPLPIPTGMPDLSRLPSAAPTYVGPPHQPEYPDEKAHIPQTHRPSPSGSSRSADAMSPMVLEASSAAPPAYRGRSYNA